MAGKKKEDQGGLQAWGRRNLNIKAPGTTTAQDSRQTIPKERQRMRVKARGRPGNPLPHLNFLNTQSPPVGCFMAPHRCPHCDDIPDDIFPLPPYSVNDSNPHPIMKTYFSLTTPPSLT